MKRSFCVLVLLCLAAYAPFAQETTDDIWGNDEPTQKSNPFAGDPAKTESSSGNPFDTKLITRPGIKEVYDTADIPFDGGLVFLLGAGALYGRKRYRDHKKKAAQAG